MTYSPLIQVRVENFQSIEDGTLKLGQLTVLVGEGDAGKSAYLRAIRAAMLNDGDDLDIRHGEKRMDVYLTFEGGTVIHWWKQAKQGGCYSLHPITEGEIETPSGYAEFTKTGGQVPEEIAQYLGIVEIEVDANTTLTPQLSDQHDQPFLLWETGSKRARIIGKTTRLDMVVTAQLGCEKELRAHQKEVEAAGATIAEAEAAITELGDPEKLAFKVKLLGDTINVVSNSVRIASRVREMSTQLEEAHSRISAAECTNLKADIIELTPQVATLTAILPLAEKLKEASTYAIAIDCTKIKDAINSIAFGAGATVEVRGLIAELEEAHTQIVVATNALLDLRNRHRDLTKRRAEECAAAGICLHCGGLLGHEECGK